MNILLTHRYCVLSCDFPAVSNILSKGCVSSDQTKSLTSNNTSTQPSHLPLLQESDWSPAQPAPASSYPSYDREMGRFEGRDQVTDC